jgi:hypothetical protein
MNASRCLPLAAGVFAVAVTLFAASSPRTPRSAPRAGAPRLPPLGGTDIVLLPKGAGRKIADNACLKCHSGDMLRQQRLTEAQWTKTVDKMIGWGAEVKPDERTALIAYLSKNFSPDNDNFEPAVTRPAGK